MRSGLRPPLVHVEHRRDGGKEKEDAADTTCEQGSRRSGETQILEDERGIVENGIDARPWNEISE